VTPEVEYLVQQLLPQAQSEAWRVFQAAPQQLDREELVSLAYTGLAMAAARWPDYCAERGFSPGCGEVPCRDPLTCGTRYFAAYSLRRMRGAMLDAMRSSDWVTRSVRGRVKLLREAGADLGRTEAELVRDTGLTREQVRDALARVARRPVSSDAEPVDVADPASVEDDVMTRSVLDAAAAAVRAQPPAVQVVLTLHYHLRREFREIAVLLGSTPDEVSEMHSAGVEAVHDAMIRAVGER
jgi:RNA polymerase sigma factor for flagellar operon FliA